jgi:hypothetical protein
MKSFNQEAYCPIYYLCVKGENCPKALTESMRNILEKNRIFYDIFSTKPNCFEEKRK